MASAPIGIVGKLPALADFVRLGASSELFQSLLTWLLDAVQRSTSTRRDWLEAVAPGRVDALVYRQRGGTSVLAGALSPSADSVGRRFPVAAAAELPLPPEFLEHPEVLPLLLERVWAITGGLVHDLQSLDRASVEAGRFGVEMELSGADALETYRTWTKEIATLDFVELVFDGAIDRAARALALAQEAVRPYRGVENPDTPLSLRLPLGRAGGAAVCFWLDVVKRLAGWRHTVPSFFWSHDGEQGALLLHLGRPPTVALAELWLPSGRCDEVCDLILPDSGAWHTESIDVWQGVLGEPQDCVSDLLRVAEGGGPRPVRVG